jgi:hypothetical protein
VMLICRKSYLFAAIRFFCKIKVVNVIVLYLFFWERFYVWIFCRFIMEFGRSFLYNYDYWYRGDFMTLILMFCSKFFINDFNYVWETLFNNSCQIVYCREFLYNNCDLGKSLQNIINFCGKSNSIIVVIIFITRRYFIWFWNNFLRLI